MSQTHDSNLQITRLTGAQRIRQRPGVVFGDDNIDGAKRCVLDLLQIFATEAQLGHCKHLQVLQNGEALTISADDRGIFLGHENGDDTVWKNIFDDFFCPPTHAPAEAGYSFPLQASSHHFLYGDPILPEQHLYADDCGCFELYCTQCASRFMEVVSVRSGIQKTLCFDRGRNQGGILTASSDKANGTSFRFALDPEVFTDTVLPAEFFLETLERFAMLLPGFSCSYTNGEICRSFCYLGGIADYVRQTPADPVFYNRLQAKGRERYNRGEYEAVVEIALTPAPGRGSTLCLHNFRQLPYGGSHLQALEERLCHAFNLCFHLEKELTIPELSRHLSIVLVSHCTPHCTLWENGTRLSIQNRVIADMTHDAAAQALEDFVYQNKAYLQPLVERISAERID